MAVTNARLIEELARSRDQLRTSEERYRDLVKASPDVVWEVNAEGVITFMSDRIEELSGYALDEVVGQHFAFLTHPDDMAPSLETFRAVQLDPSAVQQLRIRMPTRRGEHIPVEIWVTGRAQDGELVAAHGSIRDTRESERLERDLRRQAAAIAANEERAHLARELHDSVTQVLFSMTLLTRSIELLLARDPARVAERLGELRTLQRDALAEMRSLIFELRPADVEQQGLVEALRAHVAAVQGRIGLPVLFDAELNERLPAEVEAGLFRVAQEALHNIVNHAAARQVRITLARSGSTVRLRVADDGKGFDADAVDASHIGLAGMRARAERLRGSLSVETAPGRGTVIELTVPVEEPAGVVR